MMHEDPRFGTDGIRGLANSDLTADFALRLGRAAGHVLGNGTSRPALVLGRDTRVSGELIRCALAAGLMSVGVDVIDCGVLPTAGVAHATRQARAIAGGVISASHNPMPDNGIKFFGPDGRKLPDELEAQIEAVLPSWRELRSPTGDGVGQMRSGDHLVDSYRSFLASAVPAGVLQGLRIVMDCANGAASKIGPQVARELGIELELLAANPNGTNINDGAGALHPEAVRRAVVATQADLGVCFDGDADRAILVDERGQVVDGDRLMAMFALAWRGSDRLAGNQVVGTVMSNLGLEIALREAGIELLRAPVGDRHVADMMNDTGATLGGEKSGHIILGDRHTTGDGLLTFLEAAVLVRQLGQPLSELAAVVQECPQVLINVPVWRRRGWRTQAPLWEAVRAAEATLDGDGRVLVRASGTERIIRVMVEGMDEALVQKSAERIAAVVAKTMGGPPIKQPLAETAAV